MALSPSLQQFVSSGVYRLEFDRSQITNIPSETIRLIIGFSKKGPFNTPVFVQDSVFFTSVFGEIDTALERKGSFFHRTVLTCLDRGPVIVLNLLNLNDTLDTSNFRSVSTSTTDINSPVDSAPVSSFFNKDKFWFTDPEALISSASANQSVSANRLLNFANVSRRPVSIITRKSDVLGFDILAKDWFSVGKVPVWMNENDYISDYMIDVIVIEGDFSNYSSLSIDPIFGNYFDATGLKKTVKDSNGFDRDGLTSFLSLAQVNVLGVYSGSLIPEFKNKDGGNIFIQDLVNLETSKTGVLLAINQEAFDSQPFLIGGEDRQISSDLIDLVGHTIESENPGYIDFLSYFGTVVEDSTFSERRGVTGPVTYSFIAGATAGTTGANVLLTASTALSVGGSAAGYTSLGSTGFYDTVTIYGPSSSAMPTLYTSAFSTQPQFTSFVDSVSVGKFFIQSAIQATAGGATGLVNYTVINSKSYDETLNTLTLKISLTAGEGVVGPTSPNLSFYYIGGTGATLGGGTSQLRMINNTWQVPADQKLFIGQDSPIYQNNLNGILTDGDRISISAFGSTAPNANYGWVEFVRKTSNDFSGSTFNGAFSSYSPILSTRVNYAEVIAYENESLTGATAIPNTVGGTGFISFKTLSGNINESLQVDSTLTSSNPTNVVWLNNTASGPFGEGGYIGKIVKGQYLIQDFGLNGESTKINPLTGKSRLTRVISVTSDTNPLSSTYGYIKVTTNDPIFVKKMSGVWEVERYEDVREFARYYRFHTLNGYTLRDSQMPNGTSTRQNEILDVMYNSNIAQALIDREVISFRYIVDSFEGLIEPASKIKLTQLAKDRQSALAICNMPSVKQFKNSTNPLFKFDSTSGFDSQYIASGGNLSLNPSNIFNLPGIADGANYSAFYGPNLIIREGGQNISIPPAAHVSNLYIDKYSAALPYSIVAGPRRGVVTGRGLVGAEYNFDRKDLDSIEPFGYNAIVNKRGFGLTINANQTAQQSVKSALSQIHVRELLIYIQDGIEAILKNYRWEFNTAQNRLEIKTLADNFLSQILSDGGVYDFQNVMDTTNNTSEVIDNNYGILDTYVEPVRGMGILVHRTTILRTGTIATGNFI